MELTQAASEMHALKQQLAEHEAAAAKQAAELRSQIRARSLILETATEGLDLAKIEAAKKVIYVQGSYARGGTDRAAVIADAIKQLAVGAPLREHYGDLWRVAFGTKDYAHWSGQRCDCDYGMGPRHGSIVFAVGFRPDVRKRDPRELTDAEIEAAIYYLTNVERVQAAEQRAAAA